MVYQYYVKKDRSGRKKFW